MALKRKLKHKVYAIIRSQSVELAITYWLKVSCLVRLTLNVVLIFVVLDDDMLFQIKTSKIACFGWQGLLGSAV